MTSRLSPQKKTGTRFDARPSCHVPLDRRFFAHSTLHFSFDHMLDETRKEANKEGTQKGTKKRKRISTKRISTKRISKKKISTKEECGSESSSKRRTCSENEHFVCPLAPIPEHEAVRLCEEYASTQHLTCSFQTKWSYYQNLTRYMYPVLSWQDFEKKSRLYTDVVVENRVLVKNEEYICFCFSRKNGPKHRFAVDVSARKEQWSEIMKKCKFEFLACLEGFQKKKIAVVMYRGYEDCPELFLL